MPSRPQLLTGDVGQVEAVRGEAPPGRALHVPSEPDALHVMQPPVQALLQQTPSTQNPLEQSAAQEQAWPAAFFAPGEPHEPSRGTPVSAGPSTPACASRDEASCPGCPAPPSPAIWCPPPLQPLTIKAAQTAPIAPQDDFNTMEHFPLHHQTRVSGKIRSAQSEEIWPSRRGKVAGG